MQFRPPQGEHRFLAISSFGRPFWLKEVVKSEDPDRRSQYGSREYNRLLITEESLRKQAGAKNPRAPYKHTATDDPIPAIKPAAGPADRGL